MKHGALDILRKFSALLVFFYFLLAASIAYALPFNIVPKAGTDFPVIINVGETKFAYYTVTNNTASQRNNNFVKYLPPNTRQITTGGTFPDTCGATFNLAPRGAAGDSCTLQIEIFGAVNGNDPNPHNHLFVCFPGGLTCAGTNYPINVGELISITVTPELQNIFVGQTQQYTALGTYSNGNTADLTSTVEWNSSASGVAPISSSGLATGVSGGTTIITASQQGITSNPATLNVVPIVLVSIAIVPTTANAEAPDTVQYTATGTFNDGHSENLTSSATWTSSNTSVATISSTGLATAVDAGTTTITARVGGVISNAATLTVTNPIVSITITPNSATINALQTQQFFATATLAGGQLRDVTNTASWNSSDTNVATISASGLATGVGEGTTTITATQAGVTSNSATLIVNNPLVSIAVTPTTATIPVNGTQQFTAIGTFTVGDPQDITTTVDWTSDATSVATITDGTSGGVATGVSVGTTNITATQDSITSNTAVLTVNSFLYVVNNGSSISYCGVNAAGNTTGCLSNTAVTSPQEMAINKADQVAYVTNGTGLFVCSIDPESGNLTGCATTGGGIVLTTAGQIAVHPNNNFAYVVNSTGVVVCEIGAGGTLETCALSTTATQAGLQGITVQTLSGGTFAYLTSNGATEAFVCPVNNSSGALGACTGFNLTITNPFEISVRTLTGGTFAHIAGFGDDAVYTCGVNPATGAFSGGCTPSAAPVSGPRGLTLNNAGTNIYITNFTGNTVFRCPVEPNTGVIINSCTSTSGFTNPFGIALNG